MITFSSKISKIATLISLKNSYKYERRNTSKSFEVFFWHNLILTGKGCDNKYQTQYYNQFVAKSIKCHVRLSCFLKTIIWRMIGQIEVHEMFILGCRRPSQISLSPFVSSKSIKQKLFFTPNHIHYVCNSDKFPSRIFTPVLSSYEFK